MGSRRFSGGSMALYAAFLILVGIPLLALTVDVTRAYAANASLRGATEAGCLAYVRSLDTGKFIDSGETRLSPAAMGNAYEVFLPSAPEGSTLEISSETKEGRVVALCIGRKRLPALIPFLPAYNLSSRSAAKADFATTKNW